jgi:hypothetical protein
MATSEKEPKLVFVSHKSTDRDLARSLRDELKKSMGNVDFFLSEELKREMTGEQK